MKIKESELKYIALNKPKGYVSALKDNIHPTILDLVKERIKGLHIVGRLDKDTTGLIILTNDGKLTHWLTSPKKHVSKVYRVTMAKSLTTQDIEIIEKGMKIDHGKTQLLPAVVKIINDKEIELSINEGKFHQIKKMMFALNNEVIELERMSIGKLKLKDLNIKVGEYSFIDNLDTKI